jgi:hypothetical protein
VSSNLTVPANKYFINLINNFIFINLQIKYVKKYLKEIIKIA